MKPSTRKTRKLNVLYPPLIISVAINSTPANANKDKVTDPILEERQEGIEYTNRNVFSITQHRRNYLLPVTYATSPNPFGDDNLTPQNVDRVEAKYQLSVKFPLIVEEDYLSGLHLGFTTVAFWQVYNSEVSKPFREINYEPELFYKWHTDAQWLSYHLESFQLGFSHQSNGESGRRSRSWDRLFAGITLANDDVYWRAKIWYRIPESEKEFIDDATGDDNPDIESFIGRSEFVFGRRMGKFGIETTVRNNLSVNKNRGSVLLNVTYPVTDRYDVLLQYFNGYGDSLIDFNRHQQRIGLGIQLNFI